MKRCQTWSSVLLRITGTKEVCFGQYRFCPYFRNFGGKRKRLSLVQYKSLTRVLNLTQWLSKGAGGAFITVVKYLTVFSGTRCVRREGLSGGEGGVRCRHGNRASALAAALPHSLLLPVLVCSAPLRRADAPAVTVMIRWVRAPRPRHGLPVHHRVHDHHHTAAVSAAAAARRPGPAFALLSRLHQTLDQEVLTHSSLSLCLSLLCVLLLVLCSRLPFTRTRSPGEYIYFILLSLKTLLHPESPLVSSHTPDIPQSLTERSSSTRPRLPPHSLLHPCVHPFDWLYNIIFLELIAKMSVRSPLLSSNNLYISSELCAR